MECHNLYPTIEGEEVLIELKPIGEIEWYAYQKLTNDLNISSYAHRLYMFFLR